MENWLERWKVRLEGMTNEGQICFMAQGIAKAFWSDEVTMYDTPL